MEKFIGFAFKNIFRQRKRSFTLGVNYAVVAFLLVLLLSFSRGAARNISRSLVNSQAGHITVTGRFASGGKVYGGLLRTPEIQAAVAETLGPEAEIVTRYQLQSTLYYGGLSKRLSFSGIDARSDEGPRTQALFRQGSWEDFASDPNGVAVPADIAAYFGLSNGDEVVLSTRTRFGAFNTGILKVRGVYVTDNFFSRGNVLAHFAFLRDLDLAAPDAATSIYVYLPSTSGLAARRDELSARLSSLGFEASRPATDAEAIAAVSSASIKYEEDPEGRDRVMLKVSTLDEVLGLVRNVLAAVDGIGAFIAAVMLFVIAVSIFINLRMTINERMREIGTMRAVGVTSGGVAGLFVLESVLLAALFSSAGAILAAAVAIAARGLLSFPPGGDLGIFLDGGRLALSPGLDAMLAVVLAVSSLAAAFSYLPARRGGRVPPVAAMSRTF
jgi:putative ABC transport system permease protein